MPFLQPHFFNAVLYKLCLFVCVCVCECVWVCVYILNALYECVWAYLYACELVALRDLSQASKPTTLILFFLFVWWCFIALVVICGSWWWNVYAFVLDSWKVSYINGILPDPSRVFSQAGCTISHHFRFLFLNESSTPFIKTLVSNDIASQDN